MRRLYISFMTTLLISLATFGQNPSTAPPKTENCAVAGIVVRKGSNEPIHFARVTLSREGEEQKVLHAATGADGKFVIKDVVPGEYQLAVSHTGYVSEFYGARRPMEPGLPLKLTPGKQVDDLIFRMTPAGVVTGHVRDENGEALAGAQVTALLTSFVQGKRTLIPASIVVANDLGEYRLFNLTPGKYLLSAGYESREMMMASMATAFGAHEEREGLVTTYYPGTTDQLRASPVNIEPGAEVRSIDFSLQPSGVFHIRGRVSGLGPGPGGFGGAVMLRKGNSRLSAAMPERTANVKSEDGIFDLDQVASGPYEVIAFDYAGEKTRVARRSVEVGGADVDGVDLAFEPTFTITGHLRWEGKSEAPNVPLQVALEQEEEVFGQHPTAQVQPDGSFEFKDVTADTYWVNVTGPAPDAYLKSAQYGTSDALGSFRASSSSGATLELIGSNRGAHVQGVVMNSDPVPVSGVWVTLIPEDSNRKQKRLFQAVRSGANGKYEFRGVAPGNYALYSWDNVEEHEWDDAEFLKLFKSKGVSIRLEEGETKSADLTVIRT